MSVLTASSRAVELEASLPPGVLLTDPDLLAPHATDWRGWYRGDVLALARPRNAVEVGAVLRACFSEGIPVVPQGGNSSLCGASVPANGTGPSVVLSLSRLDRVRSVDATGWNLVAEAGCTLGTVQAAARGADRHFGLDFGARDTARLGGCIATNAGGMNVVRYGTCRDLVLGLEVVLPDGRLWDGLRALRKDNSGYDLKQLFLGSEGTLGVVTAACLRLHPPERHGTTALLALRDIGAANGVLDLAMGLAGGTLSAIELVPALGLKRTCADVLRIRPPIASDAPWYVLLRLASAEPVADAVEAIAASAIEAGLASDAVLSASGTQEAELWAIRDSLPALHRHLGLSHRFDLAVPLGRVPELTERLFGAVEAVAPGSVSYAFGHMGDGNLHYSACQSPDLDAKRYGELGPRIAHAVNEVCWSLGGTVSAEHGIGQLHREEMRQQKPAIELDLMRAVKRAFDPEELLNPGQLLPPAAS